MDRRAFDYTSCYCEENVWHLAGDPRIPGESRWVVFISNRDRCCLMWAQRAAPSPAEPVPWDYHVILVVRETDGPPLVYDLDTALAFPIELDRYLELAFPANERLPEKFRPRFRVIPAEEFRATFASDRSHMKDGAEWKAPPPAWPCIRTKEETMNLDRFIEMDEGSVGLDALREQFKRR